jgi:hypothetical protein
VSEIDWAALRKNADDATRPVPAGWYELVVEKAELKKAQTGADMIVVQFKVDTGAQQGKTIFTNLVFSPEKAFALNIFFKNLEAMGIDANFFASLQQQGASLEQALSTIANTIVGRNVRAEISIRTWQGQERNEIKNMTTPTGAPGGLPGGPTPAVASVGPAGGPPVPAASTPPTPPTPGASTDAAGPPTPPPPVPY